MEVVGDVEVGIVVEMNTVDPVTCKRKKKLVYEEESFFWALCTHREIERA